MPALPYIVITGCGSSGTKFTAAAWQAIGVHVAHERAGTQGVSSWYVAPGPGFSYINRKGVRLPPFKAIPWEGVEKRAIGRGVVAFHQTRHPLKVISTVQRYSSPSWQYIIHVLRKQKVDIAADTPLIKRCMLYWYHWNLMTQRQTEFRYQVEQITDPATWGLICQMTGRSDRKDMLPKIAAMPRTVNSRKRKYKPLTWAQLQEVDAKLTGRIKQLGRDYGYKIN